MINLLKLNKGTHIVRLYPNIEDLANPILKKELYFFENEIIDRQKFFELRQNTDNFSKVKAIERFACYGELNDSGKIELLTFPKSFFKIIRGHMEGNFFLSEDKRYYLRNDVIDDYSGKIKNEYKHLKEVNCTPMALFALTINKAIKFDLTKEEGFKKIYNIEIVEDDKYLVAKSDMTQEDKLNIENILKEAVEEF